MEVTCDMLEVLLPEVMDGTVPPETEEAAAAHLATCDQCRLVVDETSQVRRVARQHGKLSLPAEARDRIRQALNAEETGTG